MGILGLVKGFFTQLHRPVMSAPATKGSRKPRKRNAKGQFTSEA